MKRLRPPLFALVALLVLTATGCGAKRVKPKLRLVADGAPIPEKLAEKLLIDVQPVVGGKEAVSSPAPHLGDGLYLVNGSDDRGIPPAEYTVILEGAGKYGDFGRNGSPFKIVVTDDSDQTHILDLVKRTVTR